MRQITEFTGLSNHYLSINRFVIFLAVNLSFGFFSCSSLKSDLRKLDTNPIFSNSFTGFVLFDPESNKILHNHFGYKYFTPASNTKLLTFFLADQILGDSIPAFEYRIQQDTVVLWGTGDPSFLNPQLPKSKVYEFLKEKPIQLVRNPDDEPKYGPGWAWDDYSGSYQREKASFPIYGNAVHIWYDSINQVSRVNPPLFTDSVYYLGDRTSRSLNNNVFNIDQEWQRTDTISLPIFISDSLLVTLWSDTLSTSVEWSDYQKPKDVVPFYSIPTDSAFKELLQVSDNFIAEQLILLCSWKLSGRLNSSQTIESLNDSLLNDLPQPAVWVDGSGLSRYNLITPLSLVEILNRIYRNNEMERIKKLFPAGGQSGTIKDLYRAPTPYIYAKTGTLSNNHALSGYLHTRKGKWLIFSFMHNHYPGSSGPIKKEMEKILWQIHLKY